MAENIHLVTDMNKLQELRYKKKPIVLEFYTEYHSHYLDGVLPANPPESSSRKKSKKMLENFS